MEYKLKLKRKKYAHHADKFKIVPFPIIQDESTKYTGVFTGFSVDITDKNDICEIFNQGCFGKGSCSRSAPQIIRNINKSDEAENSSQDIPGIQETLVLDLEEAFMLAHFIKVLKILTLDGSALEGAALFDKFLKVKSSFIESMVSYLYLKSQDWVIKSGLKFGGDFLVYKKSIRLYHASFVVLISNKFSMDNKDVQGIQRVAETADKDILYLQINKPEDLNLDNNVEVLQRLQEFTVLQMILKRLDYTQYVQSGSAT